MLLTYLPPTDNKSQSKRLRRRDIFLILVISIFALGKSYLVDWIYPSNNATLEMNISYALDIALALWLGKRYAPEMFYYFKLPERSRLALSPLSIATFMLFLQVPFAHLIFKNPMHVLNGLLMVAMIGLGEEIVCRGLMFNLLRRHGLVKASIISSIIFGSLHFNHLIGGKAPFAVTMQVINATGFGLFLCGLMLNLRSIWPCIIFHACVDFPLAYDVGYAFHNRFGIWSMLADLVMPAILSITGIILLKLSREYQLIVREGVNQSMPALLVPLVPLVPLNLLIGKKNTLMINITTK
jgi:membrane protease YdiL (CAAX protease family)